MLGPKDFNKIAGNLQKGDQKSAEEIFSYFAPKIFRYFVLRIGDRDKAEDLVQNVFLKLVKRVGSYKPELGHFSSWFWQIAKNTLIDHYRENKGVVLCELNEAVLEKEDDTHSPAKDRLKEVLDATEKILNEEEREMFSLRHLSGMSFREMSQILGKSEGTLRVAIHRINRKIRHSTDVQN